MTSKRTPFHLFCIAGLVTMTAVFVSGVKTSQSHASQGSGAVERVAPSAGLQKEVSADAERRPTTPAIVETKPPEENPFPMVVRIDKSALLRYTDVEADDRRPVDQVVLGTRAVGESRTRGEIHGRLIPDSTEAAFDIRFQGQTATKTVGVQEPAVIYSRTFTDFTCARRVLFDPRKGFVIVGDTTVEGKTRLIYDGFDATRNFGRRIIARVAERRANQLFEPARLIADRDNKRQVREGFETEVERQIKAANKGTDLVRYVNRFLGDKSTLQLFAKSSPDCIHIGLGPIGEKYAPMTELPPNREKPASIEIWVHSSIIGEPVTALLKLASPQKTLSLPLQAQILGALSMTPASADHSMEVSLQDGWLVLALPENTALEKAPTANVAHQSE